MRLQREMLLLLMVLTIPLGIFYSIQWVYALRGSDPVSHGVFVVHTTSFVLTIILITLFLRHQMISIAWMSVLGINLSAILVQIRLLQQPGIILFALLTMAGPALFAPFRISIMLVSGLCTAVYLVVHWTLPANQPDWSGSLILFIALMLGLDCIGIVIRDVLKQFARTTVAIEREAIQRGQLQQQMVDLHQQVERIASLEHDVRQPLRTGLSNNISCRDGPYKL